MGGVCNKDPNFSSQSSSRYEEDSQDQVRDEKVGKYLKAIPLLSQLTDDERAILGGALVSRTYEAGDNIIVKGEKGNEFFILKTGKAVVLAPPGKLEEDEKEEKVVAELNEGDYFGEAALINNSKRGATIRATMKCECLSMDKATFEKLCGPNRLNIAFPSRQPKRGAISAEPMNARGSTKKRDGQFDKTEKEVESLLESVANNVLFKNLEHEQRLHVIQAMWRVKVKNGESIIKQGEKGDNFYIVESGEFDIFIKKEGADPVKVHHSGPGSAFGELALMYNADRAATVTAVSDAVVWAVDRYTFRRNLMKMNKQKLQEYEAFLKDVPILSSLIQHERNKVAEALEEVEFKDGDVIVKQGDEGDAFFIVKKGDVRVWKKTDADDEPKEVTRLSKGQFFGERALVKNDVRAASCIAKGDVVCLTLPREAFNRLLGPLTDIMNRIDYSKDQNQNGEEEYKQRRKSSIRSLEATIGKDELETVGVLGRGSFGLVYLMKHKKTGKTYALKQVSKAQIVQLGQQEHIMSEKNVMVQFRHPFLIQLHATYKDKDHLYFLLEVCLGGELFTLLRRRQYFDEETAKFYAASVVLAFEYMHSKNIIYRDLKPENLLLDNDGYLKIADFGFAKHVTDRTYTLCGTPDYLAPEVINGSGHGKGVDWWTLGVLIFEMLASYPPFYDDDPMKTYTKIVHAHVDYPAHFSPEARNLLQDLLNAKPIQRLGVIKGGATLIKQHPWFRGFDWKGLYARKLKAPFIPHVQDQYDIQNFGDFMDDEEDMDFPPYVDDGSGWDQFF